MPNRICGSERQTESMALNTKLRIDIPKCQTEKDESKRQTEKEWWWLWTPKLKNTTLNIKLKTDDGSERQN